METSASGPAPEGPDQTRATLVEQLRRQDGCALCRLMTRLEYKHLVRFGTAALEDRATRQVFYGGLGLCNWHGWELRRSFWGPDLAQALGDTVALLPEGLGLAGDSRGLPLREFPLHLGRCWVCRRMGEDEREYVGRLVHLLQEAPGRGLYEQSHGLCLPHLHAVLGLAPPRVREWVGPAELEQWRGLSHDLAACARKRHPAERACLTPSEETAPARCIQKLVGSHGRPWPPEEPGP